MWTTAAWDHLPNTRSQITRQSGEMKQPFQDRLSHPGLPLKEWVCEVPFSVSSSPSTLTHWFSPFSSCCLTAESEWKALLAFKKVFLHLFCPLNSCPFLILNCKGGLFFCCAAGSSPLAAPRLLGYPTLRKSRALLARPATAFQAPILHLVALHRCNEVK